MILIIPGDLLPATDVSTGPGTRGQGPDIRGVPHHHKYWAVEIWPGRCRGRDLSRVDEMAAGRRGPPAGAPGGLEPRGAAARSRPARPR